MRKYKIYSISFGLLAITGCTSLSEGEGGTLPQDGERRVRLIDDAPNSTLNYRLGEKASEINRKRNIEEFDRNGPATTPPDRRPMVVPSAPIDSTNHNLHLPYNREVRPIAD